MVERYHQDPLNSLGYQDLQAFAIQVGAAPATVSAVTGSMTMDLKGRSGIGAKPLTPEEFAFLFLVCAEIFPLDIKSFRTVVTQIDYDLRQYEMKYKYPSVPTRPQIPVQRATPTTPRTPVSTPVRMCSPTVQPRTATPLPAPRYAAPPAISTTHSSPAIIQTVPVPFPQHLIQSPKYQPKYQGLTYTNWALESEYCPDPQRALSTVHTSQPQMTGVTVAPGPGGTQEECPLTEEQDLFIEECLAADEQIRKSRVFYSAWKQYCSSQSKSRACLNKIWFRLRRCYRRQWKYYWDLSRKCIQILKRGWEHRRLAENSHDKGYHGIF